MIHKYDKTGYGKKAAFLLDAGQKVMNKENQEMLKDQAMSWKDKGVELLSYLFMPQIAELKKLSKYGEKNRLLREIKSVTIEKLTNKIIKSFAMEVAMLLPFFMIILMHYRRAVLTEPTSECYGDITRWLLKYFTGSAIFSLLRLLKVPVLRGLSHKFYFNYTLSLVIIQFLFFTTMFFLGNSVFIGAWKPDTACEPMMTDLDLAEKKRFNPIMLLAIMGAIMSFYWFIVIGILQLLLFVLILWSLWDGILHVS